MESKITTEFSFFFLNLLETSLKHNTLNHSRPFIDRHMEISQLICVDLY